jgi:Fic family protein
MPYASLERAIEDNKDLYYRALRHTQTTLKDEAPDWKPWVGFFLGCLKKQKDGLALRLDRERIARRDEDDPGPDEPAQQQVTA